MAENDDNNTSLNDLYRDISKNYTNLETTSEPSSSEFVQQLISDSIKLCDQAIMMVNNLFLFSDNEEIDELSSESIKFMVLPAYAGYFISRTQTKDRKQHVQSSKEYLQNFMKICSDYKIDRNPGEEKRAKTGDVRAEKIRRLKNKKELEQRIEKLQSYVQQDHVDEEVKREFYLSQVKRWILIAEEEIESADRELEILNMMARGDVSKLQSSNTKPSTSFRPMLLTRTKAQAKVFGAGYPSLPTYSVEEFFEMQLKDSMPPPGQLPEVSLNEEEAEEKRKQEEDEKEDNDDPDYLKEKRKFDEFKDDNRRGSGNRMNRG